MYTVYKTVNLVNGKFYIGVHKTDNPNDDYLGSGKLIIRAIEKYGLQNFQKIILETFDDLRSAFKMEEELVAKELGLPGCYNLRKGGEGGFDWINQKNLHSTKEGLKRIRELQEKDPNFWDQICKKRSMDNPDWVKACSERITTFGRSKIFKGHKHSLEALKKISEKAKMQKGKRNSQFGTCWIYKDNIERKIKVADLAMFLSNGWKQGRRSYRA
jgi:uncharacterized protein involved in tolerance to divalent cations